MDLTGKCLRDFLQYAKNYYCEYEESKRGVFLWFGNETDLLNKDCKLLLNALIIEFFDSVDIYIDIIRDEGYFEWYVNNIDGDYGFINRSEATIEAIKKANEIYNNL